MQYICTGKLHNTFGHSLCVPARRSKPQASYFFQPDNRNHSSSLHFLAFRALLTVLFLVRKYHWENMLSRWTIDCHILHLSQHKSICRVWKSTHILRHVVDFDVCCIGNKSQFLVLCTRDTAITLFRCIIRYQQCYQLSSVTSDWIDLCSVLRRIETEILLYITAEIGLWREAEHIGNLHERQWLITQQAWNIKYCITVNPIVGGISAHLF